MPVALAIHAVVATIRSDEALDGDYARLRA
jgi:hypothetical protein